MVDPVAFRSERLPTRYFDARFSEDNLRFWVPRDRPEATYVIVAAKRDGARGT